MSLPARRAVVTAFGERGLRLDARAAALLAAHVSEGGGDDAPAALARLLAAYEPGSSACLTLDAARKLVAAANGQDETPVVQVISAFDVPRVSYDPIRRAFSVAPAPPLPGGGALRLAPASARVRLYASRFHMVAQRLERHPVFARSALLPLNGGGGGGGGGAPAPGGRGACALVDVRTLASGGAAAARAAASAYALGIISQLEDGRFFLEDGTGRVPLDLDGAATSAGFFCEGCAVVVEGDVTPARALRVRALGHPPCEARSDTLAGPAAAADWFGGRPPRGAERAAAQLDAQAADAARRVVFLADCRLDAPSTLDRLATVFAGFAGAEAAPPPTFVLMGDFWGGPPRDDGARGAAFAALAAAAAAHPRLRDGSDWIFVPGPADAPVAAALPLPPLRAADAAPLRAALPRAHFPSNPARLRVHAREIVVFRSPIAATLRARALLPPVGGGDGGDATFSHAMATLLQQGTLVPLPLDAVPVHWDADGGLALYPLPHALVVAGGGAAAATAFEGVECVDPGSVARGGAFAAYAPAAGEVEMCELPGDE